MNRAAAAAVAATELRLHLSACIEMLNNREREALIFLSKGLTLQQTADTMSVGLQTVMTFRKGIYRKLQVETACEAAVLAAKAGLV